jgi:predicted permease
MESIFGKIGVFYGSVYIVVFNVFQFTFGQMLFTGEKDIKALKKALFNPGIVAVFIGLILFFSPVKLPYVASRVVDLIGSITTPLAMIIVGAMLAEVNIKEVFSGVYMYYGIAVRLLILPVIVLYTLKFAGITGNVLVVCCLLSAMPAAANSVIFAERFDGDSVLASKIVFISTVFSIVTIPLITLLL